MYPSQTTEDSSQFALWAGNRTVNEAKVQKLMQSIKKYGCFRDIVIVELNGFKYVADGQHLLAALKTLGMPVSFKTVNVDKDDIPYFIAMCNNTQSGWKLYDYLKGFLFKPDYQLIQQMSLTYSAVGLETLIRIFSSTGTTRNFRNGKYKSVRTELTESIARTLNYAKSFTVSNGRRFDESLISLMKSGYNQSEIIAGLELLDTEEAYLPDRKEAAIEMFEQCILRALGELVASA